MATSSPNAVPATDAAPIPAGSLLVHLAPLPAEALEAALSNLALAFPSQTVVVALPQMSNLTSQTSFNTIRRLPYAPVSSTTRTLTAAASARYHLGPKKAWSTRQFSIRSTALSSALALVSSRPRSSLASNVRTPGRHGATLHHRQSGGCPALAHRGSRGGLIYVH